MFVSLLIVKLITAYLINNAYKTVIRSVLFNEILRYHNKTFFYSYQLMYLY